MGFRDRPADLNRVHELEVRVRFPDLDRKQGSMVRVRDRQFPVVMGQGQGRV